MLGKSAYLTEKEIGRHIGISAFLNHQISILYLLGSTVMLRNPVLAASVSVGQQCLLLSQVCDRPGASRSAE